MFYKNLSVSGFEPRISGIGSDRSAKWATTTALYIFFYLVGIIGALIEKSHKSHWLKFHDFIIKFLLMLNSFAKWILVDLIVKHQICTVQI